MNTNTLGAVLFLVEESAAMGGPLVQANTSKHAAVTTALNAVLGQLGDWPDLAVAVLGYQAGAPGNAGVGSRWGGGLAGRDWVTVRDYLAAPLRSEPRSRKMPDGTQQQFSFPIWYDARLGAQAPATAGFQAAHNLLASWTAGPGAAAAPPLMVHLLAGPSNDGAPDQPIHDIMQLNTGKGAALLFHLHLTPSATAPVVAYPSNRALLPAGPVREFFAWSSALPASFIEGLKAAKLTLQAGARGLVYNARAAELIRFLGHVKDYARACATWSEAKPAAAAPRSMGRLPPVPTVAKTRPGTATPMPVPPSMPSPAAKTVPVAPSMAAPPPVAPAAPVIPAALATPAPVPAPEFVPIPLMPDLDHSLAATLDLPAYGVIAAEPCRLVVLVLDRSIEDVGVPGPNVWTRLQERSNEMLASIAKRGKALTSLVVTYGRDPLTDLDVVCGCDGMLSGRTFVPALELLEAALRVDEVEEQMSNGIGGIITFPRKKPVYLEREATGPCSPLPAFQEIARLLGEWYAQHPESVRPAIILHCTRGKQLLGELEEAMGALRAEIGHNAVLYHLVLTEGPMRSLSYPSSVAELQDPTLEKLWEQSSPLLGREELKAKKPFLDQDSRGFVLNGKFDLLLPE